MYALVSESGYYAASMTSDIFISLHFLTFNSDSNFVFFSFYVSFYSLCVLCKALLSSATASDVVMTLMLLTCCY